MRNFGVTHILLQYKLIFAYLASPVNEELLAVLDVRETLVVNKRKAVLTIFTLSSIKIDFAVVDLWEAFVVE